MVSEVDFRLVTRQCIMEGPHGRGRCSTNGSWEVKTERKEGGGIPISTSPPKKGMPPMI
jgi:hypothetical protein